MRAVLINPPPATEFDKHWARFPVLGLAYLAASLRDLPCEVFLLDGKLENLSAAELVAKTLELEPDFVGITCMTVEFPMLVSIAEAIKAASNANLCLGFDNPYLGLWTPRLELQTCSTSNRQKFTFETRTFANPVGYGHDDFIGSRVY